MKCNQCQSEMITDCNVNVEGDLSGIKISKKGKGFFNKVSEKCKAAVCSNCGFVAFYIDEYKKFSEQIN
jgi:predicted Zn-ribbon and HTH transcriptional regulator